MSKKEVNKGGRPKREFDVEQIRALAEIQCTLSEIAAVMRCSQDTISTRFSDIIEEAREGGKASLRRVQYKKALEGNTALLIWLGKHYLKQKDEIALTSSEPEVRQLLNRWEKTNITRGTNANKAESIEAREAKKAM